MKTSLLIIAAALFSGTVSAQNEVKAGHESGTVVNADLNPKNTKLSATHNSSTAVKSSDGSSVQGQAGTTAEIDASKTVARTGNGVHKAAEVTKARAAEVKTRTHQAAAETGAKVKAGAAATGTAATAAVKTTRVKATAAANTTRVKTRAAANTTGAATATAAHSAQVKTTAAANSAVKTTKMTTAKVKTAAPKPQVKVISNSALSIKR